jgi:hypothetical protein
MLDVKTITSGLGLFHHLLKDSVTSGRIIRTFPPEGSEHENGRHYGEGCRRRGPGERGYQAGSR